MGGEEGEDCRRSDVEPAHEEQLWEGRFQVSVPSEKKGIRRQQVPKVDQSCAASKEGTERQGLCRRQREDGSREEFVCKGQGNLHRSLTHGLPEDSHLTFRANAVVTRHEFAVLHCTEHAHCTWACGCFQFLHQHERLAEKRREK